MTADAPSSPARPSVRRRVGAGVALAIVGIAAGLAWRHLARSPGIDLRIAVTGPAAGSVESRRLPGDTFELRSIVEAHGQRSYAGSVTYRPAVAGWHLVLAALPDFRQPYALDAGAPADGAPRPGTMLGWLADGAPLVGEPLPSNAVVEDDTFISGGQVRFPTDVGAFAWQFVPVPPAGVTTAAARVLSFEPSPADLSAALAYAPPNAAWTFEQVTALLRAVAGARTWPEGVAYGEAASPAALAAMRDATAARAAVALPALDAIARGTIPDAEVVADHPQHSDAIGVSLKRRVPPAAAPLPRGIALRAAWLCAAADPATHDARVVAALAGPDADVAEAWTSFKLTGHLPAGAGGLLAREMVRQHRFGEGANDERLDAVARHILDRPWTAAEGAAFLDALVTLTPDDAGRNALARAFVPTVLGRSTDAPPADVVARWAQVKPAALRPIVARLIASRDPRFTSDDDGTLRVRR